MRSSVTVKVAVTTASAYCDTHMIAVSWHIMHIYGFKDLFEALLFKLANSIQTRIRWLNLNLMWILKKH